MGKKYRHLNGDVDLTGCIYYADLTPAISAYEMGGIRPVLVLRTLPGIRSAIVAVIAECDYSAIKLGDMDALSLHASVHIDHIRTIDQLRFRELIGKVKKYQMEAIIQSIVKLFWSVLE